jgi:hypothetical protein
MKLLSKTGITKYIEARIRAVVGPCTNATKTAGIIAGKGPKFGMKLSIPAMTTKATH